MVRRTLPSSLALVLLSLTGCGVSLHDTIGRGEMDLARRMLEDNPGLVEDRNKLGKTPLHYAVNYKRIDAMALLVEFGADVNAADHTGMTPLHGAAMLGRRQEAQWLLDHGADLAPRDRFGDTPVHTGACFGGGGVVQLLWKKGASLTEKNDEGLTPEDLAKRYHQDKMAEYIARWAQGS